MKYAPATSPVRCFAALAMLVFWIGVTTLAPAGSEVSPKGAASPPAAEKSEKSAAKPLPAEYPLDTCLVSGEKLGKRYIRHDYKGREIRFCSADCIPEFDRNPAKYIKRLDEAVIKNQTPSWPLKTCVVSGGTLGAMGKPFDYVYQGRLVRFCCKSCVTPFEKNPNKYLSMIEKARKSAPSVAIMSTSSTLSTASTASGK